MIPKNGNRFSEKIMLKQKAERWPSAAALLGTDKPMYESRDKMRSPVRACRLL